MTRIVSLETPDDCVIATAVPHTAAEFGGALALRFEKRVQLLVEAARPGAVP